MLTELQRKLFNLIKWRDGLKAPPYILELRTTNRCNLDCISCWHRIHETDKAGEWNYDDELSDEKFLEIVDEAVNVGIHRIEISGGGEPLFRHDLAMSIMERIKKGGIEASLTTNATLFRPGDLDRLVEWGWDELLISLDGPDAETHDFLRRAAGSYDIITKCLRTLKEIKAGAGGDRPKVVLVPVLCNRNYDKMADFFPMAKELGASTVRFQPLYLLGEEHNGLVLSADQKMELNDHVHRALEASAALEVETNAAEFLVTDFDQGSVPIYQEEVDQNPGEGLLASPCFYPWFYIGIRPNGSITPCIPFSEFESLDNIRDKGFLEVWNGAMYDDLREGLIRNEYHTCCTNCCGGILMDNQELRRELIHFRKIERFNFFRLAEMVDRVIEPEEENRRLTAENEELKRRA